MTVGEDGAIEALECGVDHIFGNLIEDLFLFGVHVEDLVELEHSLFVLVIDVALFAVLGNKKLRLAFLPVQACIDGGVLNPL